MHVMFPDDFVGGSEVFEQCNNQYPPGALECSIYVFILVEAAA